MKIYYIILVGVFAPLAVAAATTLPVYVTDTKVENNSAGIADTSSKSGNSYALAVPNKSVSKENLNTTATKTDNARSNVKLVNVKSTNRKKMVNSTRTNSIFKLKGNKSSNMFLLKLKAETKKTRKQQDRFVKKRTNSNASRFYKHYSQNGIF